MESGAAEGRVRTRLGATLKMLHNFYDELSAVLGEAIT